ncbi:transposase mutator type, partial [Pontibacter sp. BAB1700]
SHQNISKKWVMPLANWSQTAQQLSIWFGDRMQLDLK